MGVCALVALVGCSTSSPSSSEEGSAAPATTASGPAGVERLQQDWWAWAAGLPEETNPVLDTTGEHCARAQPDDRWLLAGSFGETLTRECAVPAGVPLAGPAVNLVAGDEAECAEFMADAEGEVTLDGAPVALDRVESAPVRFTAVAGNPVTRRGGEQDLVGCGLWFSVPGLARGEHRVVINGTGTGFALSVTYELTVGSAD